ncbi:MAG: acyltransferase [Ruminococcus sp.]|nr:acyltransferase [Ruminococcus sp.]
MNSMQLTKPRNSAIDLFRYLAAFMVVIIHSTFWQDWGYFGFFLGNIFTRIAVPFFFATSGYFYIKALLEDSKIFLKQLLHVFTMYFFWSVVYCLFDFFNQIILDKGQLVPFLKKVIVDFFIFGSTGHFWYFPALIISMCLVTLIYKLGIIKFIFPLSLLLYTIGCLGCSYTELFNSTPILNNFFTFEYFNTIRRIFLMAFPFFSMGYLLIKLESRKHLKNNKSLLIAWLVASIMFLVEIFTVIYFKIQSTIVLTFSLYLLLLITMLILIYNPLGKYRHIAAATRVIANFTYYSHPLIQLFFTLFITYTGVMFPDIIVFSATIIITFIIGLICHMIIKYKKWNLIKLIIG